MRPLRLQAMAERDLDEACLYYNSKRDGLGLTFLSDCADAFRSIRNHPETWPVLKGRTRRYLMRRFEYAVLYAILPDEILITGIVHLRRHPDSFDRRN